jgi:possible phospho-N-acetylmuramoyl-pentapeptide-transferase
MWGDIAIAFLLAFITAFVITPYTIKLAKKVGAIDMPNDRRVNKKPIPRIGGIAIIVGFIVSVIFLVISMKLENKLLFKDSNQYLEKLIGFFVGIFILSTMAYIDDIKSLKPWQKLLAQIISATVLYIFEVRIDTINEIAIHPVLSYILTVGWIVGITNAVNLIDGLDGLSSGTTLISCIFLLIIFATNGSSMISVILITALAGAITGFLPFNANPAKTFMGDVGSQFLGFSLAVISMFGIAKTVTLVVLIAPVLVLGLPIFDTLFAIIRRIKKGKSLKAVFQPDKGHLHHRLIARGYTQKQAVIILYAITAALGMFAIIFVYDGIFKALAFMFVVAIMLWIGRAELSKYNNDLLKSNKKDME